MSSTTSAAEHLIRVLPPAYTSRFATCLGQWVAIVEAGAPEAVERFGALLPEELRAGYQQTATAGGPKEFGRFLEKLVPLANDDDSRTFLTREVERAVASWSPATWGLGEQPGQQSQVSLRLADGSVVDLSFPEGRQSLMVMFEVFHRGSYAIPGAMAAPELIIDIGGHLGFASIALGRQFPSSRLVVLEPLPDNVRYLRRNWEANQLSGSIVEAALADESGEREFFSFGAQAHIAGSLLFQNWARFEGTPTTVKTMSAADLAEVAGARPGVRYGMKLDAEGGEYACLRTPSLLADAQWIVGEIHVGTEVDRNMIGELDALLNSRFKVETDSFLYNGTQFSWCFHATR